MCKTYPIPEFLEPPHLPHAAVDRGSHCSCTPWWYRRIRAHCIRQRSGWCDWTGPCGEPLPLLRDNFSPWGKMGTKSTTFLPCINYTCSTSEWLVKNYLTQVNLTQVNKHASLKWAQYNNIQNDYKYSASSHTWGKMKIIWCNTLTEDGTWWANNTEYNLNHTGIVCTYSYGKN